MTTLLLHLNRQTRYAMMTCETVEMSPGGVPPECTRCVFIELETLNSQTMEYFHRGTYPDQPEKAETT